MAISHKPLSDQVVVSTRTHVLLHEIHAPRPGRAGRGGRADLRRDEGA